MVRSSVGVGAVLGGLLLVSMGAGVPPQRNFGDPVPGLTPAELARFEFGKVQFDADQSIGEGLGPVFNDLGCGACHAGPASGGFSTQIVVRFGVVNDGIFDPLAELGGSLFQDSAIVIDELNPDLCAETIPEGAIEAVRNTPPAFGYGIVEAIDDLDILANEDPMDANADGVSGRAHMVVPLETPGGAERVGRFGLKSQVPTLLTFSGDAFLNENGVTNRLVTTENAPSGDPAILALCDTVPEDPYEDFEVAPGVEKIDAFTDFQQLLGVPPQWPPAGYLPGEAIFSQIGCATCHVPSFTSSTKAAFAALAYQTIYPYTDWLVHDIGTGDQIVFGPVTGKEFRTAPLWGMRHRSQYMHHGCVSLSSGNTIADLAQVIDGHSCGTVPNGCELDTEGSECEALPSYNAWVALSAAEKSQLLDFLGSLGRMLFDESATAWPGSLDIDKLDWAYMRQCLDAGGPGVEPEVSSGNPVLHDCLLGFDSELDGDTDLSDVADFQNHFAPAP